MSMGSLQPPYFTALCTLASWAFFFLFGHIRDFWRKRDAMHKDYAPIRQDYEDFYTRRMFYRIHDCWNRPICSAPDAYITVMERTEVNGEQALVPTGGTRRCLNLGSYNYLGFAAADETCTPQVLEALEAYGCGMCSARADAGTTPVHMALEAEVAEFVGKPAALTFGMGFATNSVIIPALVGRGCLLVSDALNHASIVAGARGSGAKVKVFAHNDAEHLEAVLRTAIAAGQPRTRRPWRKIMVVVEGIYSMEGEIAALAPIAAVTRKYKAAEAGGLRQAYLYLDEAHSIGALGATGRGACEAAGVDPAHVDIMMGTFTKSFGSCGGYIAGSRQLIAYLRRAAPGHLYADAMAPAAAAQVLAALRVIAGRAGGDTGLRKLAALRDNANYLRARLQAMGCNVLGDWDSPVMPVMLFQPAKIAAASRAALARGLALVVVGFPATPLLTARARICVSAAHTRADLDKACQVLEEVADMVLLKYQPTASAGRLATHLVKS